MAQNAQSQYDEYLQLLEHRNKLIKQLKKKDKSQIEVEKKEQGFSVYVNGENKSTKKSSRIVSSRQVQSRIERPHTGFHKTPRAVQTARHIPSSKWGQPFDINEVLAGNLVPGPSGDSARSKTAPDQAKRKAWGQVRDSGVKIKTDRGTVQQVKPPKSVTGNYSDDFDDSNEKFASDTSDDEGNNDRVQASEAVAKDNNICIELDLLEVEQLNKSLKLSLQQHSDSSSDSVPDETSHHSPFSKRKRDASSASSGSTSSAASVQEEIKSHATPDYSGDSIVFEFKSDSPTTKQQFLGAASRKQGIAPIRKSQQLSLKKKSDSDDVVDDKDTVKLVTEQVLKMKPQEQRKMQKTIEKIHKTLSPPKHKDHHSPAKENDHYIYLTLLSNYGDPNHVGLTDVSAQSVNDESVTLTVDSSRSTNIAGANTPFSNICNGQSRTTKSKNMWRCDFVNGRPPPTICLRLPDDCPPEKLKSITIWNWNATPLETLTKGVRKLEVRLPSIGFSKQIEVPKGCGNYVFDNSCTMNIKEQNITNKSIDKARTSVSNERVLTDDDAGCMMDELRHLTRGNTNTSTSYSNIRNSSPRASRQGIKLNIPSDSLSASSATSLSSKIASASDHSLLPHSSEKVASTRDLPPTGGNSTYRKEKPSVALPKEPPVVRYTPSTQRPEPMSSRPEIGQINHRRDEILLLPDPPSKPGNIDEDALFSTDTTTIGKKRHLRSKESDSKSQEMENDVDASWLSLDIFNRTNKNRLSVAAGMQSDALGGRQSKIDEVLFENDDDDDNGMQTDKNNNNNEMIKSSHRLNFNDDDLFSFTSAPSKPKSPITNSRNPSDDIIASMNLDEDCFVIPELPSGSLLRIDIKSTWGDKHYVGLNGVEVFAKDGHSVSIDSCKADPADINVLSDYDNDPRVVTNLIDGFNRTHDDLHMWLTPFTPGRRHHVWLQFARRETIALVRIWNYNKSRIHSSRGARDVDLYLDDIPIFTGEIGRACGTGEMFGDTVLFTTDDDILENVYKNDDAFISIQPEEPDDDYYDDENSLIRPPTGECIRDENYDNIARPITRVTAKQPPSQSDLVRELSDSYLDRDDKMDTMPLTNVRSVSNVSIQIMSTWGDSHYVGLTAIELILSIDEVEKCPNDWEVTEDNGLVPKLEWLDAEPRDLNVLLTDDERKDESKLDCRTIDKLIDGENVTTDDRHMWLVPYDILEPSRLDIKLPKPAEVIGLRIWNYNKSPEDTYRGVKDISVRLDGIPLPSSVSLLVRKGPGNACFDFAQDLYFYRSAEPLRAQSAYSGCRRSVKSTSKTLVAGSSNDDENEYEIPVNMPRGFIFQLQLLSTWSDPYYIGLNGIELYDENFDQIQLDQSNIAAYPDSVNAIPGAMMTDARTPDKLIDGVMETSDARHMWLAPVLPSVLNRVFIVFDVPLTISMLRIWNYGRTPSRGVKDFALLVDDLLIYTGQMRPAPDPNSSSSNTGGPIHHTILFARGGAVERAEQAAIQDEMVQRSQQNVQLMNNRRPFHAASSAASTAKSKMGIADQAQRPTTSVPGRDGHKKAK